MPEGEPVGPGILWSDTRSRELMSELLRRPGFDRRFFSDTGTHLQPCNTSMQLSWLRHYQPERLAQAHYLFFAKDWVRFRLTGGGGAGCYRRQHFAAQSAQRRTVGGCA